MGNMDTNKPSPSATHNSQHGGRKKLARAFFVAWPAAEMVGTATVAALVAIGVTDTALPGIWQAVVFVVALAIAGGVAYMSWDIRSSLREAQEEIHPGESPATANQVRTATDEATKAISELRDEIAELRADVRSMRRPWWKFWHQPHTPRT